MFRRGPCGEEYGPLCDRLGYWTVGWFCLLLCGLEIWETGDLSLKTARTRTSAAPFDPLVDSPLCNSRLGCSLRLHCLLGHEIHHSFNMTKSGFTFDRRFGVQTDPNGLLYMRARYYNPYISRFLNPDPAGFSGGLNFYAFCNGNPISETDPFGLCADQPWQNQLGGWVGNQLQTAQNFYSQNLPWAAAGTLNTAISIVGGVGLIPQAVGNVGTGSGTFAGNPTLANSAGVFQDVSVVASTLVPVAGIVDNSLATGAVAGTATPQSTAAALLNGPNGAVYQQVTQLADAMQAGNAQAVFDQLNTLAQTQAGRQQLLQIH